MTLSLSALHWAAGTVSAVCFAAALILYLLRRWARKHPELFDDDVHKD